MAADEVFFKLLPKGLALLAWFLLLEEILVAVPNLESNFVFYDKRWSKVDKFWVLLN